MRGAAVVAGALCLAAAPLWADGVASAFYADPVTRYDHDVLGDTPHYGALVLTTDTGRRVRVVLPQSRVFEDTAPRLSDIDGDGRREAVVVESDLSRGARLAVYGPDGLMAATDFIGRRHRWLAPIGAVDLDGDGRDELAYVDRPHLARVLRVVRFDGVALGEIAAMEGLTNHRIGDPVIRSGIRRCAGQAPELVVHDAGWTRIVALALRAGKLVPRPAGVSLSKALACRD